MSNEVEVGLAKSAGVVGIFAGLCGIGDCICGFMWIGYNGYGGHGLWSGFGLIVAAILGLVIWGTRNKIVMIFFLVACIVLVIVLALQAALAALVYAVWRIFQVAANCETYGGKCHCRSEDGQTTPVTLETCDAIKLIDGLFLAMTILSALGALFSLAGSIIGCMGTCCARNQNQRGVVVVQQPMGVQQTVLYSTSQYSGAYPPQYPPAQAGQYPPPQAVQYPPPQYSMAGVPEGYLQAAAIPPKA